MLLLLDYNDCPAQFRTNGTDLYTTFPVVITWGKSVAYCKELRSQLWLPHAVFFHVFFASQSGCPFMTMLGSDRRNAFKFSIWNFHNDANTEESGSQLLKYVLFFPLYPQVTCFCWHDGFLFHQPEFLEGLFNFWAIYFTNCFTHFQQWKLSSN